MRIFRDSDEWEEAGCPKDEGDWGFSTFTHGRLFTVRDGEWQAAGNWNEGFDLSPLRPFLSVGEGIPAGWMKASPGQVFVYGGTIPKGGTLADLYHDPVTAERYMRGWIPIPPITSPDLGPEPEKSPQERALDDFITKRKAKRECGGEPGLVRNMTTDEYKEVLRRCKEEEDGLKLSDALSKCFVHHQDIGERIAPFKVVRG